MFGLPKVPWGMLGIADGTGTRPDNTQEDTDALTRAFRDARLHNATPNGRVARGWDQFAPQTGQEPPMLPTPPTPAPVDMGPPALSAQAMSPQPPAAAPAVTMPMPRPPEAPQAPPDMGFFARNTAMMRDPSSGAFIDPVNAERAQASGPDVINKLMSYFHQKDNPSS